MHIPNSAKDNSEPTANKLVSSATGENFLMLINLQWSIKSYRLAYRSVNSITMIFEAPAELIDVAIIGAGTSMHMMGDGLLLPN